MPKKIKKSYFISFIAVALVFLLLCLLFDTGLLGKKSAYFNGLLVVGMFYTIIVCSLNLLTGYMGEFSLGHAGFMSIGAYASAIVTTLIANQAELPGVVLYIIAILVGGIAAGIVIAAGSLDSRGKYDRKNRRNCGARQYALCTGNA